MNPQLKAKIRSYRWLLLPSIVFSIAIVVAIQVESKVMEATLVESPPEVEPLEWLYVQGDNVLVWPVVDGACQRQSAVAQYHKGEMVLVVARAGKWIEVESEDQMRLHTHGCISETMLGPKNPDAGNVRETSQYAR